MATNLQREAFASLFAKHHLRLLRYVMTLVANRQLAEDIVQDTACLIYQKFEDYDSDQPFWPWAKQFAYFEVLKHRKKQAVQRTYFSDALIELLADERDKREDHLEPWLTALQSCLSKLHAPSRQLLLARYETEATVAEIAKQQGKSANALYLALHRIRRTLIDCIHRTLQLAEGGR